MFINIPSLHAQLGIIYVLIIVLPYILPEFKAYIISKMSLRLEVKRATISDPVKGNLLFYQGVITSMATNNPVDILSIH